MTLSVTQVILGTQVAITHAEDGETLLPVERRGVIVAVDTVKKFGKDEKGKSVIVETTRNGNPATGIKTIWVRLKKGQPPIAVKNCQLTLVHEATRAAFDEIKRDDNIKKAAELDAKKKEFEKLETSDAPEADEEIPLVVPDDPIVVNEVTPTSEGRGLTAEEIRALESGDEPEPEPENPRKVPQGNRVIPTVRPS